MYQLKIIFSVCILLLTQYELAPSESMGTISTNGMTFSWSIKDGKLRGTLEAPTNGWVAVGFNPNDGLKGTNLLMACVKADKPYLEDHYIQKPGLHTKVSELGGKSHVKVLSGKERDGYTSISFELDIEPSDRFHHELIAGNSYHILLAYSVSDDFDHHSRMRTSVYKSL